MSSPWVVHRNGEEHIFYSLSHPKKIYRKKIPPSFGDSVVVAHCGDWFLFSQRDTHFSLWKPTISDSFIRLPPLSLKPNQKITHCLLSSPPGDPDCKVLLFNYGSIIVIRPDAPHKEWTHIQTEDRLRGCVSFKGKLYAFTSQGKQLVTLNVDRANKLVIEPLCKMPSTITLNTVGTLEISFLNRFIECCGELLYVAIVFGVSDKDLNLLNEVHVFKLDFDGMSWKRAESLMGHTVFFNVFFNAEEASSSFNPVVVQE